MTTTNGRQRITDAAQLFARAERRLVAVELPSGRELILRSLTAREMGQYDKARLENKDRATELLLLYMICDEEGTPYLNESQLAQFEGIDSADYCVMVDAAYRHSGLDSNYESREFDRAVKNSASPADTTAS